VELEQGDRGSIISRTSSADYEDNKSGLGPWDEATTNDEREKTMPFLVRPIRTNDLSGTKEGDQGEGGNGPTRSVTHEWLRAEDQASEWLSLFYGTSLRTFESFPSWLMCRSGCGSRPDRLFVHSRAPVTVGDLDLPIVFHHPRLAMDIPGPLRYPLPSRGRLSPMLQSLANHRAGLHGRC